LHKLIKSVLETERKNVQDELSVLKEEFEKNKTMNIFNKIMTGIWFILFLLFLFTIRKRRKS
jgi:hypothetical protein